MYTPSHEALLAAIRAAVLQKHLLPLARPPHPRPHPRTPFEVYQYEERAELPAVEQRAREEITRELNQQLFQEERARLQLELFGLEEAIHIEDHEIALLKLQIEAERSNAKIALEARRNRLQQEAVAQRPVQARPAQEGENAEKGDLKDNSRFAIYPSLRVDFDPPRKQLEADLLRKDLPLLGLLPAEEHHKSHRQLLATYTKRSLASSQEHPKHQAPPQDPKKAKDPAAHAQEQEQSLSGLERKIAFLERAWQKARSQGQARQCRKYKQELMALIGHFWQASK